MVILVQKRHLRNLALFLAFLCGMSAVLWKGRGPSVTVSLPARISADCVYVVDPGHGGEDGGAVAGDGTVESGLNLGIALRLHDLLRFCGESTVMTRREDVSIYSGGASTLHEKKVSDLKNRVALVNSLDRAVLISIHQNKLPESPGVHGAQVFYNTVDGAEDLALQIQSELNSAVNGESRKQCKQIPKTIYLMKNVTAPAVLIECGFLSNTAETALLRQEGYQRKLAVSIAAGVLAGGKEENP